MATTEFVLIYIEMLMKQFGFKSFADMFMTDYHVGLADCEGFNSNSAWELAEAATVFVKTIQSNRINGSAEFRYFADNSVLLTVIEHGNVDEFIDEEAYNIWYDITGEYCDVEDFDIWATPKHESNAPNRRNFLGKYAGLTSKEIREYKRSGFKSVRNSHGTKKNYRRS